MVAVFAHPDDEAFGPAGTLAMCAASGIRVTVVVATRGEAGRRRGDPPFCTPAQLGGVRWAEVEESCRILGLMPPVWLGLADRNASRYRESHIRVLAGILEDTSPRVIITLGPRGGLSAHPDHVAASRLTLEAWRASGSRARLCYFERQPDPGPVARIHGVLPAHLVVSVKDWRGTRLAALRAHRTQTEQIGSLWLPDSEVIPRLPACENFLVPDPALQGLRISGGESILFSDPGNGDVPERD